MKQNRKLPYWLNRFIYFAFLFFFLSSLSACGSGPCDYPDDTARDGSRCGDRAASVRPGGRNPDLNKFLWSAVTIGGVVAFFVLVSNSNSSKPQNRSAQFSPKPIKRRESAKSIQKKIERQPASFVPYVEPTLANIEKVLWSTFDYKIDPMFKQTFIEIASTCKIKGYTATDGAILYMFAVIAMVKPSIADQSMKDFVNSHLDTCQSLLSKGNLPKVETGEHIVALRSFFK